MINNSIRKNVGWELLSIFIGVWIWLGQSISTTVHFRNVCTFLGAGDHDELKCQLKMDDLASDPDHRVRSSYTGLFDDLSTIKYLSWGVFIFFVCMTYINRE